MILNTHRKRFNEVFIKINTHGIMKRGKAYLVWNSMRYNKKYSAVVESAPPSRFIGLA